MGVLLIAAVIVVSTAIGVWAEGWRPRQAAAGARRALLGFLYVVLPPVYFLNLAAAHISLDNGLGLLLALLSISLSAFVVYWVASRVLRLARNQVGAVVVATMVVNTSILGFP